MGKLGFPHKSEQHNRRLIVKFVSVLGHTWDCDSDLLAVITVVTAKIPSRYPYLVCNPTSSYLGPHTYSAGGSAWGYPLNSGWLPSNFKSLSIRYQSDIIVGATAKKYEIF